MLHQHPGGLALTKKLIDYCNFTPGAKVLDVGCGAGTTVEYLSKCYELQAVGVDIAEARLQQGRERSPDLQLMLADGKMLPFADAYFDGVTAECSLSVMPNPAAVFAEISRILRPGGKLAITDVFLPDSDSSAGYLNYHHLVNMLRDTGFTLVVWEDHSNFLREFVASYIMTHGSLQELCQCIVIPKTKVGYFLLVAEKCQGKG